MATNPGPSAAKRPRPTPLETQVNQLTRIERRNQQIIRDNARIIEHQQLKRKIQTWQRLDAEQEHLCAKWDPILLARNEPLAVYYHSENYYDDALTFPTTDLFPYQVVGVRRLYRNLIKYDTGAALVHCMGTGKTLQGIMLLYFALKQPDISHCLLLCPKNVVENWKAEIRHWLPDNTDIVLSRNTWIMSYESFIRMTDPPTFDLLIFDEGHLLKNVNSKKYNQVFELKTRKRAMLTGTPIQNDLTEYFNLMDLIVPSVFGSYQWFKKEYIQPIRSGGNKISTAQQQTQRQKTLQHLETLVRPFVDYCHRTNQQLPPKYDHVVLIKLEKQQETIYKAFLNSIQRRQPFADLKQAQLIWTHPFLFYVSEKLNYFLQSSADKPTTDDDEDDDDTTETDGEISKSRTRLVLIWEMIAKHNSQLQSVLESSPEERANYIQRQRDRLVGEQRQARRKQRRAERKRLRSETSSEYSKTGETPPPSSPERSRSSSSDRSFLRGPGHDVAEEEEPIASASSSEDDDLVIVRNRDRNRQRRLDRTLKRLELPTPVEFESEEAPASSSSENEEISTNIDNWKQHLQWRLQRKYRARYPVSSSSDDDKSTDADDDLDIPQVAVDEQQLLADAAGENVTEIESAPINQLDDGVFSQRWWFEYNLAAITTTHASKMQVLEQLLTEFIRVGDKTLIFTTSLFTLVYLNNWLRKLYPTDRINYVFGATATARRFKIFSEFQAGQYDVMVLSTAAAGIGCNLTAANRVVLMDVSWNPAVDVQAIFRTYRIGQQKPVYIYRLVMMNTSEDQIFKKQVMKTILSERLLKRVNYQPTSNDHELSAFYDYQTPPPKPAVGSGCSLSNEILADSVAAHISSLDAVYGVEMVDNLFKQSELSMNCASTSQSPTICLQLHRDLNLTSIMAATRNIPAIMNNPATTSVIEPNEQRAIEIMRQYQSVPRQTRNSIYTDLNQFTQTVSRQMGQWELQQSIPQYIETLRRLANNYESFLTSVSVPYASATDTVRLQIDLAKYFVSDLLKEIQQRLDRLSTVVQ